MLINDKVDAVYIPDSPSRIKATDYNQIKNEIQECITEAGLTPTKDVIQLPQALKILTEQSGAEEIAKIEAAGQEQLDAINTAGAQAVQDAQTAANTATAKATEAAESAGEAASSASAAASSASAASGSASTATTQATNASASAELAQKWATQTTAEVVSGQGYGAKYYADQAADSAASVVQDAEAAAASATAAAGSASAAAQSAQDAAKSAQEAAALSATVPVGALLMGPVATMPGYILCDGRAVSRTQYAALFAAIGTNFGAGDGSSTFNVPDYRGCFLRMAGGSAGTMYQKQPQGLPDVVGSMPVNPGGKNTGAFSQSNGASHNLYGYSSDITIFASSASNSIYGAANEVRPVNFAVNYFIKY